MLEIHIDQSSFSSYMKKLAGNFETADLQITAFGTEGDCLYGNAAFSSIPSEMLANLSGQWIRNGPQMVKADSILGGKAWIYYQIPEIQYYSQLIICLAGMIAVFLPLIGTMLVLTHSISKKITRPIIQLSNELNHLDLAHPQDIGLVDTSLLEINLIAQTTADLGKKLSASMDEIVAAKTLSLIHI